MRDLTIGFAITGSFCTFKAVFPQMNLLVEHGYHVLPIMSENVYTTDTRFGRAADWVAQAEEVCGEKVIHTIAQAEPIGPKKLLDLLILAPCTMVFISMMIYHFGPENKGLIMALWLVTPGRCISDRMAFVIPAIGCLSDCVLIKSDTRFLSSSV